MNNYPTTSRSNIRYPFLLRKFSFYSLLIMLFSLSQTTISFGFSGNILTDIPSKNINSGQLLLTNVQLKSEVETHYIALLTATNLSNQTLQLGTGEAPDINIKFEESFSRHPLQPYKEDIIEALMNADLQILARKTARGVELMLEKTKPLAEKYVGQGYNSQLFKVKKKKYTTRKRKIRKPSTEEPTNETLDSAVKIAENEETALPKEEKESSDLNSDEKEEKEEIVVDKVMITTKDVEEIIKTADPITETEIIEEEIVLTPSNDPLTEKTESTIKKEKKPFIKLSKRKKVTQEEKESISFTSNIEEEAVKIEEEPFYYNESACADIVIDSVAVIKNQKDKWLTVQYTITNQGTKSADLYGKAGDDGDNLAIKVFLASSKNLTRGSIPTGGYFIKSGVDDGILLPNQSHTGTFKIDIRKKTSFTPFLIFSADHFNVMIECDKTNNKNHLFVQ